MTAGYIGRSWGLDPRALVAEAGLPPRDGRPLTLDQIAEARGVPVGTVIAEVEAALAAAAGARRRRPMTDWLLAAVPGYGPWLVAAVTFLSCLALPVPASLLMLAAGGFAAAGDLALWQVAGGALAGAVAGDQAGLLGGAGGRPCPDVAAWRRTGARAATLAQGARPAGRERVPPRSS